MIVSVSPTKRNSKPKSINEETIKSSKVTPKIKVRETNDLVAAAKTKDISKITASLLACEGIPRFFLAELFMQCEDTYAEWDKVHTQILPEDAQLPPTLAEYVSRARKKQPYQNWDELVKYVLQMPSFLLNLCLGAMLKDRDTCSPYRTKDLLMRLGMIGFLLYGGTLHKNSHPQQQTNAGNKRPEARAKTSLGEPDVINEYPDADEVYDDYDYENEYQYINESTPLVIRTESSNTNENGESHSKPVLHHQKSSLPNETKTFAKHDCQKLNEGILLSAEKQSTKMGNDERMSILKLEIQNEASIQSGFGPSASDVLLQCDIKANSLDAASSKTHHQILPNTSKEASTLVLTAKSTKDSQTYNSSVTKEKVCASNEKVANDRSDALRYDEDLLQSSESKEAIDHSSKNLAEFTVAHQGSNMGPPPFLKDYRYVVQKYCDTSSLDTKFEMVGSRPLLQIVSCPLCTYTVRSDSEDGGDFEHELQSAYGEHVLLSHCDPISQKPYEETLLIILAKQLYIDNPKQEVDGRIFTCPKCLQVDVSRMCHYIHVLGHANQHNHLSCLACNIWFEDYKNLFDHYVQHHEVSRASLPDPKDMPPFTFKVKKSYMNTFEKKIVRAPLTTEYIQLYIQMEKKHRGILPELKARANMRNKPDGDCIRSMIQKFLPDLSFLCAVSEEHTQTELQDSASSIPHSRKFEVHVLLKEDASNDLSDKKTSITSIQLFKVKQKIDRFLSEYQCHYCCFKFSSISARSNHEEQMHADQVKNHKVRSFEKDNCANDKSDSTMYKCNFCVSQFEAEVDRDDHMKEVHKLEAIEMILQQDPRLKACDWVDLGYAHLLKKCQSCGYSTTAQVSLEKHKKEMHFVQTYYMCIICGLLFSSETEQMRHQKICINREASGQASKCSKCGDAFESMRLLDIHLKFINCMDDPNFKPADTAEYPKGILVPGYPVVDCDDGIYDYLDVSTWIYFCQYCGEKFNDDSSRDCHEDKHPEHVLKRFKNGELDAEECVNLGYEHLLKKCCVCDFKATSSAAIVKHEKTMHPHAFRCKKCGKTYRLKKKLILHENTCDSEPLKCEKCGLVCLNYNILQEHQKNVNCGDPNYSPDVPNPYVAKKKSCDLKGESRLCDKCGCVFKNKNGLRIHKKNTKCSDSPKLIKPVRKRQASRKYPCEKCGKMTLKRNLQFHQTMVNCTNDPDFVRPPESVKKYYCHVCKKCGKKFRKRRSLYLHNAVVNCDNSDDFKPKPVIRPKKKTPYVACPRCGKTIAKYSLKQHLSVVNCTNDPNFNPARLEKPSTCMKCGKVFKLKDYLNYHMAVVNCNKDPNFKKKWTRKSKHDKQPVGKRSLKLKMELQSGYTDNVNVAHHDILLKDSNVANKDHEEPFHEKGQASKTTGVHSNDSESDGHETESLNHSADVVSQEGTLHGQENHQIKKMNDPDVTTVYQHDESPVKGAQNTNKIDISGFKIVVSGRNDGNNTNRVSTPSSRTPTLEKSRRTQLDRKNVVTTACQKSTPGIVASKIADVSSMPQFSSQIQTNSQSVRIEPSIKPRSIRKVDLDGEHSKANPHGNLIRERCVTTPVSETMHGKSTAVTIQRIAERKVVHVPSSAEKKACLTSGQVQSSLKKPLAPAISCHQMNPSRGTAVPCQQNTHVTEVMHQQPHPITRVIPRTAMTQQHLVHSSTAVTPQQQLHRTQSSSERIPVAIAHRGQNVPQTQQFQQVIFDASRTNNDDQVIIEGDQYIEIVESSGQGMDNEQLIQVLASPQQNQCFTLDEASGDTIVYLN